MLLLQEPVAGQWEDLRNALPRYDGLMGTMGGAWSHHHAEGVCYRKDRFTEAGRGQFWISRTPEVSASILQPNHWGPRITTWVKLCDRLTGRDLLAASTHFDTHHGSSVEAAGIVSAELAKLAGDAPVILGGDFNVPAGMPAWRRLTFEEGWSDAWRAAGRTDEGVVTYNGFRPVDRMPLADPAILNAYLRAKYHAHWEKFGLDAARHWRNERIDWILTKGPLRAISATVDTRTFGGRTASDHYAVNVSLAWS